jgi:hypothetical protein
VSEVFYISDIIAARRAAARNLQPRPAESVAVRITDSEQRAELAYALHVITEECQLNILKMNHARRCYPGVKLPPNYEEEFTRLGRAFIHKWEAARKLRSMVSHARIGDTLEIHTRFFVTKDLEPNWPKAVA